MDTMSPAPASRATPEPAADRESRLAWEAERLAEAEASLAAGLFVSSEAVDAWIDSLDTDDELPPPRAGQ